MIQALPDWIAGQVDPHSQEWHLQYNGIRRWWTYEQGNGVVILKKYDDVDRGYVDSVIKSFPVDPPLAVHWPKSEVPLIGPQTEIEEYLKLNGRWWEIGGKDPDTLLEAEWQELQWIEERFEELLAPRANIPDYFMPPAWRKKK